MSGPSWQPPRLAQARINTQKALSRGFRMINMLIGTYRTVSHPRILSLFIFIVSIQKDSSGQPLKSKFRLAYKAKCHLHGTFPGLLSESQLPLPPTPQALWAFYKHLSSAWRLFCRVSWLASIKVSTLWARHLCLLRNLVWVPGRGSVNICRRNKWLMGGRGYL